MKFGIILPNYGEYCDQDLLSKAVGVAEEEGFDHALVWDHYTLPWSSKCLEAWSLLAFLAARTSRIRLGTCVTPIPLRPPATLAKVVSTLDNLSGGRVILGVGAGWHEPEFQGFSTWDEAATRVAKTKEGLELILKLWSEKEVDFKGRFYSAKKAVLEPKPAQKPHPPLWFGTRGHYMLRLLAMYGDGWIPISVSPRSYRQLKREIDRLAAIQGRGERITYVYDADASTSVKKLANEVEQYKEAGCEYYSMAWEYPRSEFVERIRWFSHNVASSFT